MTVHDSFFNRLTAISNFNAPPVNNACVPNIYNKLDAETIERTRVINALLDKQLAVQEKVLNKYRNHAEQMYKKERELVWKELKSTRKRLPSMASLPNTDAIKKYKEIRKSYAKVRTPIGYTTTPIETGLSTEKDNKPFCKRFFIHHQPEKSSWYKQIIKNVAHGQRRFGLQSGRSKGKSRHLLISRGLSASENCLVAGKSLPIIENVPHDDEDAMTI
ncbi:hypothetical protein KUTeg_014165 [Tegillarca granosa]|uniref:Uncharacterized protein n=1 Tax=Tegillarca granosa TaxID=220873 RepID=A0ABQ9EVT7_TEGGR|nr:hypothetical protein KUTeg_014165 [Tegillarca granosa]